MMSVMFMSSAISVISGFTAISVTLVYLGTGTVVNRQFSLFKPVLRIRIEKMRMRIQEKISMWMRIHTLTELWRAK
jgi:hypothetical protein